MVPSLVPDEDRCTNDGEAEQDHANDESPVWRWTIASIQSRLAEVAVLESAELSVVLLMDLEVEVMVNTPETIFGMAVAAFVVESSVIDVGSEK